MNQTRIRIPQRPDLPALAALRCHDAEEQKDL